MNLDYLSFMSAMVAALIDDYQLNSLEANLLTLKFNEIIRKVLFPAG